MSFYLVCKYFFENLKKSLQSGGFREVRSGYSKHNFFPALSRAISTESGRRKGEKIGVKE